MGGNRGPVWQNSVQRVPKAVSANTEEGYIETPPSEVAPALIREKSNYALVIELTDNLSSIATYLAYPYSNRFEHFFDTRDNADAELVNLEPV